MSLSLKEIVNLFLPGHTIESIKSLENGLINDTYLVTSRRNTLIKKIILQKVNSHVYLSPEVVIQNHVMLFSTLYNNQSVEKIISTLYKSISGKYFFQDNQDYWRAQSYTDNTVNYDEVLDANVAFEGAKIVGKFNAKFALLKNILLQSPIKGFHNLKYHLSRFEILLKEKSNNRIHKCITEIKFILRYKDEMVNIFEQSQKLPSRICHYDTKINNILFDKKSNKAIQIIDLDNAMNGKVIFDFGDMMRTFISPADENKKDFTQIKIRWKIMEEMTRGYLNETNEILTQEEKSMLVSGGILITYQQAIRFLIDYLNSDKYYKTKYSNHNLNRTKNQICLVKLFMENKIELEKYTTHRI